MKRDLISLTDLSPDEILQLLDVALDLKSKKGQLRDVLKGKSVGLIFQKPSNRTRVSFEVGIHQLGGNCVYLGPKEINLGKRETPSDVANTLSRYLDAIVARTFLNSDVIDLANHATIPIINGLSDLYHPCQALADLLSVKENFQDLKGMTLTYVGDGNNVCHSLMLGCAKVGMHMHIASPKGYAPKEKVLSQAKEFAQSSGATIKLFTSPREAIHNTHVVYTDVWVSMGQEEESQERIDLFKEFQINNDLTALADKDYIFMHCLPAHRGQEVTAEVIDGPHSIIFDQAENRMHIQKAILMFLLGSH